MREVTPLLSRNDRQKELHDLLSEDPFQTDEELADRFGVSVQTIRLDRLSLGIPELRERTRTMAQQVHDMVKSMGYREMIGELVDLRLGESGISIVETTDDMVFERTRVVRSHYIFAQADSLALAIVDADIALTGLANVKYKRLVKAGEKLVARGRIIRRKGENTYVVQIVTTSQGEQVFRAKFVVFAVPREEESE